MKKVIEQIMECIVTVLPFFKKKNAKEIQEFSDLITGQYEFLVQQLEKMLQDYLDLSEKIKEMHAEMFNLKDELGKALTQQCTAKDCTSRI
ncbi:hypothetical protein [uncultured Bacteroides sp.]|uniref:hypothetical protein n=1 Tax=uncultured Bacteroides sp. TaxID=162156 RepID=UPI002AA883EE|nr:hypothetical protein [uncultured Bacteroides sp.]